MAKAYVILYKKNIEKHGTLIDFKKHTMTHELGYALSMAHPPTGTESIMVPGLSPDYAAKTYDKSELKRKWGN